MTAAPLISVALTTYNGERYLSRQLASLSAQDYPRFEIVAVDDASQDRTPQLLAEHAAREPRLRYFFNSRNRGLAANFAYAFSLCQGELIAPCDQDDLWSPGKLTCLATALREAQPLACMAYCDSELIDEDGRPLGRRISDKLLLANVENPLGFAFSNCVSGHAMLFKRELLAHALPFPRGVFYDWWLAFIAASLSRIVYVDQALVGYRQHPEAQTDFVGQRERVRRRGHKTDDLRIIEARLAAFAGFEQGPWAPVFAELHRLWRRRNGQWFCWRLTTLLVRERQRLFAFNRDERRRRMRRALKFFWGLRLKRLVQPYQYADG